MMLEGHGALLGVMGELKGEKRVDRTIFHCIK